MVLKNPKLHLFGGYAAACIGLMFLFNQFHFDLALWPDTTFRHVTLSLFGPVLALWTHFTFVGFIVGSIVVLSIANRAATAKLNRTFLWVLAALAWIAFGAFFGFGI